MPNDSNVGGLSGNAINKYNFCGVWLNGVLEQSNWLGGSTVREACSQAFVTSPISVPNA